MNNPFDYVPDRRCQQAFENLLRKLDQLKNSADPETRNFLRELEEGKMLGVLIAEDGDGISRCLYAFSGQLGSFGFRYPGFVEPVFDYLDPHGYFKQHERRITGFSIKIDRLEKVDLAAAIAAYEEVCSKEDAEIMRFRDVCRRSKKLRDAERAEETPDAGAEAEARRIRQSQFEKAELRRMKQRKAERVDSYEKRIADLRRRVEELRVRRRIESEALQRWLFDNFILLNSKGECKSLTRIFGSTSLGQPPSGAGECCAPKLLQGAYTRGWKPVAIAEYWYGRPKEGEVRCHRNYYPACRGKCLPVLTWMLEGLEIYPPLKSEYHSAAEGTDNPVVIYQNRYFCVINKPAGMLSVPGKRADGSLEEWLRNQYPDRKELKMVHRLDQDTSGLIIAAFDSHTYKSLQSLFATRKVQKEYMALLCGDYRNMGKPRIGRVELPLSPDWLDRPRQRVDRECGKSAVTDYEFIGVEEGKSRVLFSPHTGRTHQLRIHAAASDGLGMPIAGDPLYGIRSRLPGRMMLHAAKISFTFPEDGKAYHFEVAAPF